MKKTIILFFVVFLSSIIQAQPCPSITSFSVISPGCFGTGNGSIVINYTAGTSPYTVTWSNGIQMTSSALSQTINNIPAGAYSATVTDNGSCLTSQFVNVTQPSLLTLSVPASPTICSGQNTSIYAAGSGGTPPYSYTWNNGFVGGGPHTVNPSNTTSYTVSITDANGCTTQPKTINVNVMPALNAVGSAYTICNGGTVTLTPIITSAGSGGPYSYNWSSGESTSSITVSGSPGVNSYTVSIDDGCTIPGSIAVFTVNINTCAGINELTENNSITIFPNPAKDFLLISSNEQIHKLEITNVTGEFLVSEIIRSNSHQLNLRDFPEGIYFLRINYSNKNGSIKKIIINR